MRIDDFPNQVRSSETQRLDDFHQKSSDLKQFLQEGKIDTFKLMNLVNENHKNVVQRGVN